MIKKIVINYQNNQNPKIKSKRSIQIPDPKETAYK
jgi:hypothetical protein